MGWREDSKNKIYLLFNIDQEYYDTTQLDVFHISSSWTQWDVNSQKKLAAFQGV